MIRGNDLVLLTVESPHGCFRGPRREIGISRPAERNSGREESGFFGHETEDSNASVRLSGNVQACRVDVVFLADSGKDFEYQCQFRAKGGIDVAVPTARRLRHQNECGMFLLVFLSCPEIRAQLVVPRNLSEIVVAGAAAPMQPDHEGVRGVLVIRAGHVQTVWHGLASASVDAAKES